MNRRGFLTGIIAACAAPAIIRTPGLIMPIKPSIALPDVPPLLWIIDMQEKIMSLRPTELWVPRENMDIAQRLLNA